MACCSFSPKHNVIVGRNGSGKSNFFDAIQFVLLGPKFSSLRQEDRQHLLHEGAGSSVMAAYVEIVFDNSDGRLSVESDEVILRRTVGHKKDEFFLNRKRVQKSEVMSLLESAGFSKSNPYYIVQQGKVANLCVMKDKDRLDLLKGVAGTTVYEERRAESVKIIQDTANKKEKVEEVLTFIEERLGELEQEKKELTEYEQLDKQRRALEFSLYDKEYKKASDQLQQMDEVREEERERQHALYTELSEIQDELSKRDDAYTTVQLALERMVTRREAKGAELSELVTKRSSIEVELQETEAAARASGTESAKLSEQLQEVLRQVQKRERELRAIEPEHAAKTAQLAEMEAEVMAVRSQVETLYGKQGRGAQFNSKADRDRFLQTQIDSLSAQIEQKTALLQRTNREVEAEEQRLRGEQEQVDLAELQHRARLERYEEIGTLIRERTIYRNELQEQRKSGWRELEKYQEQIQEARQELEKGKQQLNRALPRHITQGLAAVEEIVQQKGITGYLGPLIDNITLRSAGLRNAVEVAAGNALFHVIVDTDTTAAFLIKELDRLKAGRLTFLPLNRLHNPHIRYPDSNDVRPLMSAALEYEASVEIAVKQVFGHKLLARDLEVAARFSKECDLDAITKEGDLVNRKGGFEGGFHDERASRIGAVFKIRESRAALDALLQKERELKEASEQAEAKVSEVVRELQQLETEKSHLRQNGDQLTREIKTRTKQLEAAMAGLEAQKKGISAQQSQIQVATAQQEAYRKEQASALVEKLSTKERAELSRLEERQRALQSDIETLEKDVMRVTAAKDKITADLNGNLLKSKEELERTLAEVSEDASGGNDFETALANLQVEKDHCKAQFASLQKEVAEMDAIIAQKRSEGAADEKALDEQRSAEQQLQEKIAEATKMLDKLLNKRSMLLETVQSRQRMIRDLGTLPRKEMEDVRNLSEKQLMSTLKEVNERLKKYSSVNRKALDQFVSFNEQRETLMQRKDEMDRDSVAIQQMIESLDAQKDEAILRTFRGVSHHFAEVFSELVPGGAGQLIMRTSMDTAQSKNQAAAASSSSAAAGKNAEGEDESTENLQDRILDDEDEENPTTGPGALAISTFQGVQVRVSFSGAGQQYQMNQLSGGQKALVALALIFAIQRCDPAPFYLFDEIDQALDANYRAGVARLIHKQVNSETAPAQFITTTFRPELVAAADRCYGIGLLNKVSNIYSLEKSKAQKFVTDLLLEEEAVGAVSAVPGRRTGRGAAAAQQAQHAQPAQNDDQEEEEEVGSGNEDRDENGDEEEEDALEEVKSPSKIRRIQRAAVGAPPSKAGTAAGGRGSKSGAAAAAKPSKAAFGARGKGGVQTKGKATRRGSRSKNQEESEGSAGSEGASDDEGGGEGMIELDEEEAAAFANLGLQDAQDEHDDESDA